MDQNRFPSAPEPFVRRVEVAGRLKTANWQSEPLDVLVDIDELGATRPKCLVVGNQQVAISVRKVLDPPSEIRLDPATEHGLTRVFGIGLLPTAIHFRGIDAHLPEGPTGVIARLNGGSFRIEHHSDELKRNPEPEIRFLLRGRSPSLGVVHLPIQHPDGRVESETTHAELELPEDLPWKVRLEPTYRFTKSTDGHRLAAQQWALVLKHRQAASGITPELAEEAQQFADDFLLVWSFAARRSLTWHAYSFPTSDGYVELHRTVRESRDAEQHRGDSLLLERDHRRFVCSGVAAYRAARAEGRDLLLPLAMAISANEKLYMEQRFATLFMAVEKLKDQHARVIGIDRVLAKKDFDDVRKKLSDALDSLKNQLGDGKLKSMKEKLLELNRPPVNAVLQSMFDKHGVEWRDLYPSSLPTDRGPPFVSVRNTLFHSSDRVPSNRLFLETERVRAVLERLLLRMLGWQDLGGAPGALKHHLQKEMGDQEER